MCGAGRIPDHASKTPIPRTHLVKHPRRVPAGTGTICKHRATPGDARHHAIPRHATPGNGLAKCTNPCKLHDATPRRAFSAMLRQARPRHAFHINNAMRSMTVYVWSVPHPSHASHAKWRPTPMRGPGFSPRSTPSMHTKFQTPSASGACISHHGFSVGEDPCGGMRGCPTRRTFPSGT